MSRADPTPGTVTLALCGDVMLGRGVDQVLPHPGDPMLWERHIRDARDYVRLAEAANGTIARPVDVDWPWGDALDELARAQVRVLNLETSVTADGVPAAGKGIHYRMHPANLPCLAAARPDVCVLANNHVLDFGHNGLDHTIAALHQAGLRTAGAGRDADQAWRPAVVAVPTGRVLVFAVGVASSGIPTAWAAGVGRPGVAFVPELTDRQAARITQRARRLRRPGDLVVVSVHWGANWGYAATPEESRFAHALIDGGVDVVHGHSSHHPRPIEIYRGRLVLYGCGDLINDYEGIGGHERYRAELRLLYLASVGADSGDLRALRLTPLRAERMRLWPATDEQTRWLATTLAAGGCGLGVRIDRDGAGLRARPA